ncbi:MAG: HNH endonuclease [Kiritimatiellaeota bacterium]|nr:HNH endonuclease [Kiritimatiellota bacterium]
MYSSEDRADLLAAFETADGIYNLCGGRIFATGRVKSEPEYVDVEEESHFRGGKFFVDIGDIHVLKNPIPLENFNDFIRIAQRSVTPLSSNQAGKLAELINSKKEENDCDDLESVVETFGKEGKKRQYYTTRYERDPKIRKAAIKAHRKKYGALPCHVCGFDYEKTYGEHGRGFIEVHHIKPLSSKDEEVEVNPETDLVCLCANCHRMIHRSGILTPNELIFLFSGNTRCRG